MHCGICAESLNLCETIYGIHTEGRLVPAVITGTWIRFESAAIQSVVNLLHIAAKSERHSPSYTPLIRYALKLISRFHTKHIIYTFYYYKKWIKLIFKCHLSHDGSMVKIMLQNCISAKSETETATIYRCGLFLYSPSLIEWALAVFFRHSCCDFCISRLRFRFLVKLL